MKRREFMQTMAAGLAMFAAPAMLTMAKQLWASTPGDGRLRENFNSDWLFERQKHGGGALGSFDRNPVLGSQVEPKFRDVTRIDYDDSDWDPVRLPHTWNAFDSCDEIPGYFRGIGWYRKHFELGEDRRGKRVFLEFRDSFHRFMARFSRQLQGVVAIDGKVLRRSFDRASGKSALHMVSAWGLEQRLVLAQIATDAKSNEITAVTKLFRMLALKGAIVTADALKGNQGTLLDDVVLLLDDPELEASASAPVVEAEHGRIETRTAMVPRRSTG